MKSFKYNNAIINVHGEVDRDRIEQAAMKFMKKVVTRTKKRMKERK